MAARAPLRSAVRPRKMHASTRFAIQFAIGASAIVAIGTLLSEIVIDSTRQPFAPPPLGLTSAILSVGTFIWSYVIAAGSAWSLAAIDSATPWEGYLGGALFALLTPALGFALWEFDFLVFAIVMLTWVIIFPAAFTFIVARRARSNEVLKRTRAG